jgi:hypothetical protein
MKVRDETKELLIGQSTDRTEHLNQRGRGPVQASFIVTATELLVERFEGGGPQFAVGFMLF